MKALSHTGSLRAEPTSQIPVLIASGETTGFLREVSSLAHLLMIPSLCSLQGKKGLGKPFSVNQLDFNVIELISKSKRNTLIRPNLCLVSTIF